MALKLYNSKTRAKQDFVPLGPHYQQAVGTNLKIHEIRWWGH